MNWQPIETAPKDGSVVLLYVGMIRPDYACAHWNGHFWEVINPECVCDGFWSEFGQPTHWMPLSPPARNDA